MPFKSHGELVAHKRQATSCWRTKSEDSMPDGIICNTKMIELKSRKDLPRHDDREKWMKIWTILFPDIPPPVSPCQSSPVRPEGKYSNPINNVLDAEHVDVMRKSDLMKDFENFLKARVSVLTEDMISMNRGGLEKAARLGQIVSDWLDAAFLQYREGLGIDQHLEPMTTLSMRKGFVESPRSISPEGTRTLQPSLVTNFSKPYAITSGLCGSIEGSKCHNRVDPAIYGTDCLPDNDWANQYVIPPADEVFRNGTGGLYDYRAGFESACDWTTLPAVDEQSTMLPLPGVPEHIAGDNSSCFAGISTSPANPDLGFSTWT